MALGAGAAAVGIGMAAGGTAAAIRAQRMKTKPKPVNYGGSAEAADGYRDLYAGKMDEGAATRQAGTLGLGQSAFDARQTAQRGNTIMDASLARVPTADTRGASILEQYDPAKAAQMQSQIAADESARLNLAAAGGSALDRRNAMNANAEMGVRAAQQAALAGEQGQAAKIGALAGQYNNEFGMKDASRAANLREAQLGAGLVGMGQGNALQANNGLVNTGMGLESTYLGANQNLEGTQAQLDLDYERRRQAEQQRKSQNLWGLGSSLISGGGKVLGGASG